MFRYIYAFFNFYIKFLKNLIEIQQLQQFDNLEIIARQVVEGTIIGLHRSPFHGFSVEFAEHRLYNSGESIKHIDWKLFARTEKLFVKCFEEETNLRSYILIDTSSSMLFPWQAKNTRSEIISTQSKIVFSAYCAAALVYLLHKQRDASGLALFSDDIELFIDSKLTSLHTKRIYGEIGKLLHTDTLSLKRTTNTSGVLHQIAENIHKRSLIIIFSDMLETGNADDIFPALQHLRYNKHEVILFHVTDKKHEEEFEFKNRPYKFIDLETGDEVRFNPNDIRNEYKQSVNEYFSELKLKCGQYNIDLINADINNDFKDILIPYLIKRKKLF